MQGEASTPLGSEFQKLRIRLKGKIWILLAPKPKPIKKESANNGLKFL